MAIQYNRYQCRSCGKPALHVPSTYDVPHIGYVVVLGFLSVNTLIARDAAIGSLCVFAGAVVVGLWVIHTAANWLLAGAAYRCQIGGTEPGESQKAI